MQTALGYSPQAYHKHNKKQFIQHFNEGLILEQIDTIHKQQPRCGGRKSFIMLTSFFEKHNICIGRDKFFELLKRNKLLIRKTKREGLYHYEQTSLLPLSLPGEGVYAIEGTWALGKWYYLYTTEREVCLPVFNHRCLGKIVGFHVSDDMKVSSAVVALKKAVAQKPPETIVIHHSDRGIQSIAAQSM